MNRQEKLREDIAELLRWQLDGDLDDSGETVPHPDWCNSGNCKLYNEQCRYCVGDQVLELMASQGCVLKVERGADPSRMTRQYSEALLDMLRRMHTATEPLIMEVPNDRGSRTEV